jgi:hypothetical protein
MEYWNIGILEISNNPSLRAIRAHTGPYGQAGRQAYRQAGIPTQNNDIQEKPSGVWTTFSRIKKKEGKIVWSGGEISAS